MQDRKEDHISLRAYGSTPKIGRYDKDDNRNDDYEHG